MRKTRTMPNPRKSSVIHERVGALMAEFGFYHSPAEADRSQPIEPVLSQQAQPVLNWPVADKEELYLSLPSLPN